MAKVEPQERVGVRRGLMLVLSSPSGAGKSTLARTLLQQEGDLALSISVTTRARRASEVEGIHYHFITPREFARMRDGGDLLEWAEVHGNFYGTPREPVMAALAAGRDVLFDIDWQGAKQLRDDPTLTEDLVSVFVLPPSAAELRARLDRRAEDADDVIARRLRNARLEIQHWPEYDYVLVNEDLDPSSTGLRAILIAERMRRTRNPAVAALVERLDRELGELLAES